MTSSGQLTLLTVDEADRIVALIRDNFRVVVRRFDHKKYPLETYERLLRAFTDRSRVCNTDIRDAIVWKFGHTGKPRIPARHEDLISAIQRQWPDLCAKGIGGKVAFAQFAADIGKNRFITAAFLFHLMNPNEIPIIDQHNFRAVNYYCRRVRPEWQSKARPSRYEDIVTLASFMSVIKQRWRVIDSSTVPSARDFDKFLMMYGKSLKQRRHESAGEPWEPKIADRKLAPDMKSSSHRIELPYGGSGCFFDISDLVRHVTATGRNYIIQGQTNCRMDKHPKPGSLDFWLRRNFAKNPDTKQAVTAVVQQLTATGLFEVGDFCCPDSGRNCKGVRLVSVGPA